MMASFLGHMLRVMDLKRNLFGSAMNLPRFIVTVLSLYLRLRLALRALALTCDDLAHFGRDQICTQDKARFTPFATQPKSAQDK